MANVIGALSTSIKAVGAGISSGVSSIMSKTSAMVHNVADRLFPVCAACFDGRVIIRSPLTDCRHQFHSECLNTWTQRSFTCPLDRGPLNRNGARNRTLKLLFVGAALVAGASIYAYNPFSAPNGVNLGHNFPSGNSYFNEFVAFRKELERTVENGDLNGVNELLTDPRFAEIGVEGFLRILEMAATSDHLDILNVLIASAQIDKTLVEACRFGFWGAIKALVASERFAEVTLESFGTVLETASIEGELDIVNLLVEDPRFAEMDIEHLGKSLEYASYSGYPGRLDVVNLLMANSRFAEIGIEHLGKSLINVMVGPFWPAHPEGKLGLLNALIQNSRFSEISVSDLEKSLEEAIHEGHLLAVEAIASSNRFAEISSDCLGRIFIEVCETGDSNLLEVLITNPRFAEINIDVLKAGLQHASNSQYWLVMHALAGSSRNAEIFSDF